VSKYDGWVYQSEVAAPVTFLSQPIAEASVSSFCWKWAWRTGLEDENGDELGRRPGYNGAGKQLSAVLI